MDFSLIEEQIVLIKTKKNFRLLSLKYPNPDEFRIPFSKKLEMSKHKTTGMTAII